MIRASSGTAPLQPGDQAVQQMAGDGRSSCIHGDISVGHTGVNSALLEVGVTRRPTTELVSLVVPIIRGDNASRMVVEGRDRDCYCGIPVVSSRFTPKSGICGRLMAQGMHAVLWMRGPDDFVNNGKCFAKFAGPAACHSVQVAGVRLNRTSCVTDGIRCTRLDVGDGMRLFLFDEGNKRLACQAEYDIDDSGSVLEGSFNPYGNGQWDAVTTVFSGGPFGYLSRVAKILTTRAPATEVYAGEWNGSDALDQPTPGDCNACDVHELLTLVRRESEAVRNKLVAEYRGQVDQPDELVGRLDESQEYLIGQSCSVDGIIDLVALRKAIQDLYESEMSGKLQRMRSLREYMFYGSQPPSLEGALPVVEVPTVPDVVEERPLVAQFPATQFKWPKVTVFEDVVDEIACQQVIECVSSAIEERPPDEVRIGVWKTVAGAVAHAIPERGAARKRHRMINNVTNRVHKLATIIGEFKLAHPTIGKTAADKQGFRYQFGKMLRDRGDVSQRDKLWMLEIGFAVYHIPSSDSKFIEEIERMVCVPK